MQDESEVYTSVLEEEGNAPYNTKTTLYNNSSKQLAQLLLSVLIVLLPSQIVLWLDQAIQSEKK